MPEEIEMQTSPSERKLEPAESEQEEANGVEEKKEEVVVAIEEKEKPNKENACKRFCKRWFIDAFSGMALGLFCTLIAGLIIKQIGLLFGSNVVGVFLTTVGTVATLLTGCGIGAGIGHALNAPRLVVFCALVVGFLGANSSALAKGTLLVSGKMTLGGPGDPISAYLAAICSVEIGLLVAGKTKLDILVVPLVTLLVGSIVAVFLGPPIASLLTAVGNVIEAATTLQPILMGIVVSVIMGVLLTLPTSSAAIGISIGLNGISAAAATAGCACHMVGFAVSSFKENGWGGLIAQGLGTSMLQIPNLVKNPLIMIPPIVASIIAGPVAAAGFKLKCNPAGSGMGTSGLVGVIMTWSESIKELSALRVAIGIIVCFFVIPAMVSYFASLLMRKKGWIKDGDMDINSN